MDRDARLKRLKFRAWHRGTREADYMIGGFFDAYSEGWGDAERDWFEAFIEAQDVDILAWGMATAEVPPRWNGPLMTAFRQLDYIRTPAG